MVKVICQMCGFKTEIKYFIKQQQIKQKGIKVRSVLFVIQCMNCKNLFPLYTEPLEVGEKQSEKYKEELSKAADYIG